MLELTNNISGWTAAHSPVVLEFLRKDLNIICIAYDTNYPLYTKVVIAKNNFNFLDLTIYINSNQYDGNYVVKNQTSDSTYTYLYLDTAYNGTSWGGYIVSDNYNLNYSIDLQLLKSSSLITTLNFGTFTDGVATVDLSSILSKNITQFPSSTSLSTNISSVSDAYSLFTFNYREKYSGYTAGYSILPNTFCGINAVLQDGTINDGTLNGYVPLLSSTTASTTTGKFLQTFAEPVMNVNNSFELDFVYDGGLTTLYPLTLYVNQLDINKNILSTYSASITEAAAGKLCRINLGNIALTGSPCYFEAYVKAGSTPSLYIAEDYISWGYFDDEPAVTPLTPTKIIDSLFIKLDYNNENLIQLRWINLMGGISQWTFSRNNYILNENKNSKSIITNDSTKVSNINVLSNSFNKYITVGVEGITEQQAEELSLINVAQIYLNGVWQNVSVEHKNEEFSARGVAGKRELTIRLNPKRTHKF